MVLKRLFRTRGRIHQQSDHEGSKASSRATLDSSFDSFVQFLPQHVGEATDAFFERDDISSIHYGESVGSPPTTEQYRASSYKNQNPTLIKSLRSTEELDFLVPSTLDTLKVIDCLDEDETSSIGGEANDDNNCRPKANPVDLKALKAQLGMDGSELDKRSPEQKLREELGIDDGTPESTVDIAGPTHNGAKEAREKQNSNSRDNCMTASTEFSLFCVSLLSDNIDREILPSTSDATPISERVVRESLKRHLELNISAPSANESNDDITEDDIDQLLKAGIDSDEVEGMARLLIATGKYDEAIYLYKKILEQQQIFPDAETTAETYGKISILHLCRGDMGRALSYSKKSLKMNREESRQAQSTTSLMSVGLVYLGANRLDSALLAWKGAMQTACQIFGYDHPFVAILLNNIGCLHFLHDNLPASLKTLSESLDMQRKFLRSSVGMDSDLLLLDIAVTTGNIARIATKNGDLDTAAALFEEVLSLQESVLDDRDHPLICSTNCAIKYISQCQATNGRESFAPVAVSTRKPTVTTTKTDGTSVASKTNTNRNSEVALPVQNIGLMNGTKLSIFGNNDGIPMRRVGAKSPLDAMDDTDNLDVLMLGSLKSEYTPRQRVRATILRWFGKSLQEDEDKKFPAVPHDKTPRKRMRIPVDCDHDNVVDAELYLHGINEQATEHLEHNEIDEALDLFESVLASHKDKYGDIHHLVGSATHNIGLVQLFAERYGPAMDSFQEALAVRRAALGMEHPDVAASMMSIGMIQLVHRESEQARDTFLRVLVLLRRVLGYGHIQVARVLNNLAVALYDMGAYLDAFRTFQQAHEIQRRLYVLSQAENTTILNQTRIIELALANTLNNLGFMYCRQKKYADSLRMLEEASKMRRRHLGEHHPLIVNGEENLRYVRGKVPKNEPGNAQNLKKKENTLDLLCGAAGNASRQTM